MSADGYIVVRNWERFQHYRDRTPPWVKTYTELLDDDAYRRLPGATRAVLHGVWMAYAKSRRTLPASTLELTRRLGLRVSGRQLEALVQAGFIDIVASTALAERLHDASASRAREEKEEEKDSPYPAERGNGTPRERGENPRALGTNPRAVAKRTQPERNARRWIDNGLAAHIPPEHLEEVIADEFDLRDPELVADLAAYAREHAHHE